MFKPVELSVLSVCYAGERTLLRNVMCLRAGLVLGVGLTGLRMNSSLVEGLKISQTMWPCQWAYGTGVVAWL